MNNQPLDNENSSDDDIPSLVMKDPSDPSSNLLNDKPDDMPITVRIKTMDETEKRIEVFLDEKVSDLKNKIRDQLNVPIDRQRLIYLGKQLKDDQKLKECKIKNDVCILLVANRVQNQNQNQPQRQPAAAQNNDGPANEFDLPSFIFNALNESAQMRRNRRLLFQQNARSFLRNLRLNVSQSRETIVQNLSSTELLIESLKDIEDVKTPETGTDAGLD